MHHIAGMVCMLAMALSAGCSGLNTALCDKVLYFYPMPVIACELRGADYSNELPRVPLVCLTT